MDKVAYIDAASRLGMIASFAVADANEGNEYVPKPVDKKTLELRINQAEDYVSKMKIALA